VRAKMNKANANRARVEKGENTKDERQLGHVKKGENCDCE